MSYTEADVSAAIAKMEKYRSGLDYEVNAALAVVGLSAERAGKEIAIRDDMIRVAHRAGASLRQIAEASGLGRKTVTAIVEADPARAQGVTTAPSASHLVGASHPGSKPPIAARLAPRQRKSSSM